MQHVRQLIVRKAHSRATSPPNNTKLQSSSPTRIKVERVGANQNGVYQSQNDDREWIQGDGGEATEYSRATVSTTQPPQNTLAMGPTQMTSKNSNDTSSLLITDASRTLKTSSTANHASLAVSLAKKELDKVLLPPKVVERLKETFHDHHEGIGTFWGIHQILTEHCNLQVSPPLLARIIYEQELSVPQQQMKLLARNNREKENGNDVAYNNNISTLSSRRKVSAMLSSSAMERSLLQRGKKGKKISLTAPPVSDEAFSQVETDDEVDAIDGPKQVSVSNKNPTSGLSFTNNPTGESFSIVAGSNISEPDVVLDEDTFVLLVQAIAFDSRYDEEFRTDDQSLVRVAVKDSIPEIASEYHHKVLSEILRRGGGDATAGKSSSSTGSGGRPQQEQQKRGKNDVGIGYDEKRGLDFPFSSGASGGNQIESDREPSVGGTANYFPSSSSAAAAAISSYNTINQAAQQAAVIMSVKGPRTVADLEKLMKKVSTAAGVLGGRRTNAEQTPDNKNGDNNNGRSGGGNRNSLSRSDSTIEHDSDGAKNGSLALAFSALSSRDGKPLLSSLALDTFLAAFNLQPAMEDLAPEKYKRAKIQAAENIISMAAAASASSATGLATSAGFSSLSSAPYRDASPSGGAALDVMKDGSDDSLQMDANASGGGNGRRTNFREGNVHNTSRNRSGDNSNNSNNNTTGNLDLNKISGLLQKLGNNGGGNVNSSSSTVAAAFGGLIISKLSSPLGFAAASSVTSPLQSSATTAARSPQQAVLSNASSAFPLIGTPSSQGLTVTDEPIEIEMLCEKLNIPPAPAQKRQPPPTAEGRLLQKNIAGGNNNQEFLFKSKLGGLTAPSYLAPVSSVKKSYLATGDDNNSTNTRIVTNIGTHAHVNNSSLHHGVEINEEQISDWLLNGFDDNKAVLVQSRGYALSSSASVRQAQISSSASPLSAALAFSKRAKGRHHGGGWANNEVDDAPQESERVRREREKSESFRSDEFEEDRLASSVTHFPSRQRAPRRAQKEDFDDIEKNYNSTGGNYYKGVVLPLGGSLPLSPKKSSVTVVDHHENSSRLSMSASVTSISMMKDTAPTKTKVGGEHEQAVLEEEDRSPRRRGTPENNAYKYMYYTGNEKKIMEERENDPSPEGGGGEGVGEEQQFSDSYHYSYSHHQGIEHVGGGLNEDDEKKTHKIENDDNENNNNNNNKSKKGFSRMRIIRYPTEEERRPWRYPPASLNAAVSQRGRSSSLPSVSAVAAHGRGGEEALSPATSFSSSYAAKKRRTVVEASQPTKFSGYESQAHVNRDSTDQTNTNNKNPISLNEPFHDYSASELRELRPFVPPTAQQCIDEALRSRQYAALGEVLQADTEGADRARGCVYANETPLKRPKTVPIPFQKKIVSKVSAMTGRSPVNSPDGILFSVEKDTVFPNKNRRASSSNIGRTSSTAAPYRGNTNSRSTVSADVLPRNSLRGSSSLSPLPLSPKSRHQTSLSNEAATTAGAQKNTLSNDPPAANDDASFSSSFAASSSDSSAYKQAMDPQMLRWVSSTKHPSPTHVVGAGGGGMRTTLSKRK